MERLEGLNKISSTLLTAEAGTLRPQESCPELQGSCPTAPAATCRPSHAPAPSQGKFELRTNRRGPFPPALPSQVLIMVYCKAAFHSELFRRTIPILLAQPGPKNRHPLRGSLSLPPTWRKEHGPQPSVRAARHLASGYSCRRELWGAVFLGVR